MKKRVLSLLLCLCLLSSTVVLFASCGKKKVELAGYGVVYGADLSDSADAAVRSFASTLAAKTDGDVSVVEVGSEDDVADEAKNEILIGNTNRSESAKVLKKIKGHGYAIKATGGKIVIVGTTNLLTCIALNLFVDTYLTGKESVGELEIVKTEVEKMDMLELSSAWSFVYNQQLDGKEDYLNKRVEETKALIAQSSSIQGKAMKQISDLTTAEQEILVSVVNRDEFRTVSSGMNANDYGLAMRNGKLVVAALGDTMADKALTLLADTVKDSVCVQEVDGSEKKLVFLPADFTLIYTAADAGIVTDFPKPDGITLVGTQDVHDSSTQYYYEGAGINVDAYNAYCDKLMSMGYRRYGTRIETQGSISATYVNEAENVSLHVTYSNFKWVIAAETDHKKAIRIIASPLDCVNLLDEELYTMNLNYDNVLKEHGKTDVKMQEPSITSLKLNYQAGASGNFYVVALEDGSFIVVDGGMSGADDHQNLYNVLYDLYTSADHLEFEPTAEDPIRIAAWYVTHGHNDHYGAMRDFIDTYCAAYDQYHVTIDRLLANFPSDKEIFNSGSSNSTLRNTYAELSAKVTDAPGKEQGFKYCKLHTGQRFWLANVEIEVLYTHEDAYPRKLHNYDDTGTVIRMNMYHTRRGELSPNSKTSMLWLGDAQTLTSQWLRATYGEYIQSTMVQMANQGALGCEYALYKQIKPVCTWWPTSRASFQNLAHDADSVTDYVRINYNICYKLSSLKYCILSDVCNYTLPITASGADYEGIYDAGGRSSVFWTDVVKFAGLQPPVTGLLKTSRA